MKLYVCIIESHIELRTIVSAGVLAVLLLACAGMAAGETWVVDDDGGAGVNYTTIQDAVDASSAGDTIEVRSGTYVENVDVNKRLTLIGDGVDVVTVQSEDRLDHALEVTADYVNISGFKVTGTGTTYETKAGFYLDGADHCNISNNDASENHYGIYLESSSNNTFSSNNASKNHYGIHLKHSSNNTLSKNTVSGNTASSDDNGIYLESSSNNTLTENTASENQVGISLLSSSNNTLLNNTALSNNKYGIYLSDSSNNTLTNNNASSNDDYGIYLSDSSNNTLSNNNASSNDGGGIKLYSSSNNNMLTNNTALSNNEYGIYLQSSSNNNMLSSNNASSNRYGIHLEFSSNNNMLTNNNASSNDYGIYLSSSSNNTLTNNTVLENQFGIELDYSSNNMLTENTASENQVGISLLSSGNNTLTNNNASSNDDYGIYLSDSSNNTLLNNTASSNDGGGIKLHSSSNNNMLSSNTASNNTWDLYVVGSESAFRDNTLSGTTISFTYEGDMLLRGVGSPAADPAGWNTIGKFISATNQSAGAWIFLNFSYSGSDLSGLDESSLKVWKHNGTNWIEDGWNGTRYLDVGGNVIGVNITSFSVFAPAALAAATYIPPDPAGLANTTGRYWVNYTWSAGTGDVTDSYNVSMNEGWKNGTTETFRNVSVAPGRWANITVFAYNRSGTGTLSSGSISDNVQVPGINCTCGNICVNQTGWWRDNGAFNTNGTPIQAAIDSATDGDIICVWTGSYSENVNVNKRLTLIGDGADVVVLAGYESDHVFEVTADYVNISGFTVNGTTSSMYAGIYLKGADHCNIYENTASGNRDGIYLSESSNNTLASNTANSNGYAEAGCGIILLASSDNNTLMNNTVNSNNGYGIYLSESSNNTLSSNTVSDNAWDDLYIVNSESVFRDNTLSGTTISFTYAGDVSLKGVGSPAADPAGWNTIGKFISATGQSAGAWIFLNFSYSGSDLSGLDESSLKVWKHNGTTWIEDSWNGTRYLDVGGNVIGVNITSFSVFAPAAPPGITCDCGNICVNQTGWWRDGSAFNVNGTPIQAAIDSATDGDTICVRNGSYIENVDVPKRLTLRGESADVVTVRAEDISDHAFEVTADYVNISGFTATGAATPYATKAGFYLGGADHCNISNNDASESLVGIYLNSASDNTLTNNNASGNDLDGIRLGSSSNNTLTNNNANSNLGGGGCGIRLGSSSNNTLTNNKVLENPHGIELSSSNYNMLTNNTVLENNYDGIRLDSSSNNTLTNNTVLENNRYGILLFGSLPYSSSNNNMLSGNTVSDNAWSDLCIVNSESTFSNNTLNGTTISFTYEGDLLLRGVGSPAPDPAGWNTIGKFISVTNQSAGAWIFLNFSYSGSDLSGLDESSLKVWKHNGTTWIEDGWNGTRYLDVGGNVIGVNITSFSVFAPAASAAAYTPPDPTDLTNTTDGSWVNYTWSAGTGDVTDSYNVSMNEKWANGTTETFRDVSVGPGGWANITVFAYNASGTGTLSSGNISDNVWASALSTLPENCDRGNICVNQTGWWHDGGAFNASGTPIQAAIDSATDGDIICVWNGNYSENVNMNKRLTIQSKNGLASTIVHAANSSVPVFEVTADYVNISGFTVKGGWELGSAGIYLGSNVGHCNLSSNNITNNSEGIHLASTASGNIINFNNIVGNFAYGIHNENISVNATCNWWGDVSGPSEAGNGTGDNISVNVDYDPWLNSPYPEGKPIYFTNVIVTTVNGTTEIDAQAVADTNVTINTTAPVNVTIGNYSRNPGAVFDGDDGDIGKYIDVHVNDTTNVSWINITLYYTDDEITDLYESSLRMYWWNGSAWEECSDGGVNTSGVDNYSGYVWANISSDTTPNLSEFDGLPLTAGGRKRPLSLAPRSRSAGIYPSPTPTPTLAPSPLATPTPGPSPTPTPAPSSLATPTPSPSPTKTSSFPTNPLSAVPSKITMILIAAVYLVLRRKAR